MFSWFSWVKLRGSRKKPWPNGTPNISQLRPSYNIKTCISGWPNDTAKSSQLARNQLKPTQAKLQYQNLHQRVAKRYRQVEPACKKPFNCLNIRPRSHITITKQLGESWLELVKRWKTWLELGENLSFIKFKPSRSNSSQLKPSEWPNDTQLHRRCELGSSWLEMGGPFGRTRNRLNRLWTRLSNITTDSLIESDPRFNPFTPKFKYKHLSFEKATKSHTVWCYILVRLLGKFEIYHSWEWKG